MPHDLFTITEAKAKLPEIVRRSADHDASTLPAPAVLAAEIVDELEAALTQFSELAASLPIEPTVSES